MYMYMYVDLISQKRQFNRYTLPLTPGRDVTSGMYMYCTVHVYESGSTCMWYKFDAITTNRNVYQNGHLQTATS